MITADVMARLERSFHDHERHEGVTSDIGIAFSSLKETAMELVAVTPPGREQSLMITKLEEALFWALAAITREGR